MTRRVLYQLFHPDLHEYGLGRLCEDPSFLVNLLCYPHTQKMLSYPILDRVPWKLRVLSHWCRCKKKFVSRFFLFMFTLFLHEPRPFNADHSRFGVYKDARSNWIFITAWKYFFLFRISFFGFRIWVSTTFFRLPFFVFNFCSCF